MKQLRQYQEALIKKVRASFAKGYRRILMQLATGGGKSVIFAKIIQMAYQKNKSVLFLVHRRELILQASGHMVEEEIEHGIIMSKVPPSFMARVQLGSIQTIWSRCHTTKKVPFPDADIIIIDEAHRAGSKTYTEIMKQYPKAMILGVTATPVRKGGLGLGDCFDDLLLGASVRELTEQGYLAEAEYMVPNVPDLSKVKVQAGDWVESQLSAVMNDKKLIGDTLSHFQKYAHEKKTIMFSVDIAHSLAMFEKFSGAGYRIAHVDGKTDLKTRNNIFRDLSSGALQMITNVGVATEGVDIPSVECMVDVAPTKSLGLYLQKGGRALRPKEDGSKALILDHTGNWWRHGSLDTEHEWSLDVHEKIQERDRKKQEKKEGGEKKEFACPSCGHVFAKSNVCPKCSYKIGVNVKDVESHRGELVKATTKEKKEVSFEEKDLFHGMLLKYAKDKGYKPSWAYYKYQAKFKEKPLNNFANIPLLPTAEFTRYAKYLQIKAAKSKYRRKA